ncbi:MAG: hypothetical protein AAFR62_18205, partial [Cyanobacteria bacterium J06629_2]
MLESPVRLKKLSVQPHPRDKKPQFKKYHQIIILVLLCSLGWWAIRSLNHRTGDSSMKSTRRRFFV